MQKSIKSYAPATVLILFMMCDIFIHPFYSAVKYNARIAIIAACFSLLVSFLVLYAAIKIKEKGTATSKIIRFICGALLLVSAANSFVRTEQFYRYLSDATLPLVIVALVFICIAIYSAHMPQNALYKISIIALALCIATMAFMIISNAANFRIENLSLDTNVNIANVCLANTFFAPELLLYFLLISNEKTVKLNNLAVPFIIIAAIYIALTVSAELVLGSAYVLQSQPAHTLSRLGGISVFKRVDAFFASIWILAATIKFSFFFRFAVEQLFCIKQTNMHYLAMGAAIAVLIGVAYTIPSKEMNFILSIGTLIMLFACAINMKNKAKKEQTNGASH